MGVAGAKGRFVTVGSDGTLLASGLLPREARMNIPRRIYEGLIQVTATAPVGNSYTLEASTDLENWAKLTNGVSTNFTMQYLDGTPKNIGHRYYRAVRQVPN